MCHHTDGRTFCRGKSLRLRLGILMSCFGNHGLAFACTLDCISIYRRPKYSYFLGQELDERAHVSKIEAELRSFAPARGRAPRAITRSIWPTSPKPLLFSHRPGPAARFFSLARPRPALRPWICDRSRGGGARAGRDTFSCCRPPVPLVTSRPLLDPDGS